MVEVEVGGGGVRVSERVVHVAHTTTVLSHVTLIKDPTLVVDVVVSLIHSVQVAESGAGTPPFGGGTYFNIIRGGRRRGRKRGGKEMGHCFIEPFSLTHQFFVSFLN